MTPDGESPRCPHDAASGIDTYFGPDKVWRCDHCGLLWRQDEEPLTISDLTGFVQAEVARERKNEAMSEDQWAKEKSLLKLVCEHLRTQLEAIRVLCEQANARTPDDFEPDDYGTQGMVNADAILSIIDRKNPS